MSYSSLHRPMESHIAHSIHSEGDFVTQRFAQAIAVHAVFALRAEEAGITIGDMDPRLASAVECLGESDEWFGGTSMSNQGYVSTEACASQRMNPSAAFEPLAAEACPVVELTEHRQALRGCLKKRPAELKPHRLADTVSFCNLVRAHYGPGQLSSETLKEEGQHIDANSVCQDEALTQCPASPGLITTNFVTLSEVQCVAHDMGLASQIFNPGCCLHDFSGELRAEGSSFTSLGGPHGQDKTHDHKDAEQRVVLDLATLVPVSKNTESTLNRNGLCDKLQVLDSFVLQAMCQDVASLGRLHNTTRAALRNMAVWNRSDAVDALRLYVDGSYVESTSKAGWAVVALGLVRSEWAFVGYFSDRLYESGHTRWLGNASVNAHVAELAAMTCALAVAIANECQHCEIVYDAMAAAGIAEGIYQCHELAAMAHATTSLTVRAWKLGVKIGYRHVAAHTGDAFNELADVVAKATTRTPALIACDFEDGLANIVMSQVRDWLWFIGVQDETCALPSAESNSDHLAATTPRPPLLTAHVKEGSIPGVPTGAVVDSHEEPWDASWSMRAATYNALTLQSEARRQMLDTTFWQDAVHLLGLQESREVLDGPRHLCYFVCFGSAAVGGQGGCQLWINKQAVVARRRDGTEVRFDWRKAVVVVSKPRLLCVTVPAGGCLFAVLVGHAYTSQATDDSIQLFWHELDCALRALPRRAVPLILLDGNARFRIDHVLATAGDCEPIGLNAARFGQLLSEHELATQHLRDADGKDLVTWRSPSGHEGCIDYIAFSDAFLSCAKAVVPSHFVDTIGHDHLPVVVEWTWRSGAVGDKKVVHWDTE